MSGALSRRWLLLLMVHGLILAHVVEIWVFALGYYIAEHWPRANTGRRAGLVRLLLIIPPWCIRPLALAIWSSGAQRLITGAEALAGLSMITWSASFTFLQMQRIWRS